MAVRAELVLLRYNRQLKSLRGMLSVPTDRGSSSGKSAKTKLHNGKAATWPLVLGIRRNREERRGRATGRDNNSGNELGRNEERQNSGSAPPGGAPLHVGDPADI